MRATLYDLGPVGARRLAIVPRPRGGDWLADELAALREAGVHALASLLTAPEREELGLTEEPAQAASAGLAFLALELEDRSVPGDAAAFAELISALCAHLAGSECVAVHCRQSIGRASLVAAAVLVRHGASPAEAWRRVEAARGRPVPDTEEQRRYLDSLA